MPTRAKNACPTPGCPNITIRGRCTNCKRTADRKRGTAAQRGYDATWNTRRKRYLQDHPTCELPTCTHPSTDVHHLDGRGPRGNNHDSNLQALCHAHHSSITARQTAFGG